MERPSGATIKRIDALNPQCWIPAERLEWEHWRRRMTGRGGAIDTQAALAMLEAFASVGAAAFDVTLLDIEGREQGFQRNRSLDELRHSIGRRLEAATGQQHSIVIRPRSTAALLIQLDDFTAEKAVPLAPHTFMTVCTSPNNFQVWLAVSDGPKETEAAKQLRTRVRRGAGADQSATGAVRLVGSLNFKSRYATDFPVITLSQVSAGRMTTIEALDKANLIAPAPTTPPASVPPQNPPARAARGRLWPDYQQALRGAPLKGDGSHDRSLADFMFCKWAVQRGWSIEETAEKLAEVSPKAQERMRVKADAGYTLLTARNAAAAVERDRSRRQALKGTVRL
jgi:RepB DNA-primase from phage plasmid